MLHVGDPSISWTITRPSVDDNNVLLKSWDGASDSRRGSGTIHVQELFHENAQVSQSHAQPWWRVKLFVWEPVLFGTWDGVFTTCMINIFGVVLFLRTGWLVGNAGVLLGMLLVSLVVVVALVTVFSGIGVCERCSVGGGGVYSMISTVLGRRVGGTIGLLYVFGQCVAGAMYITGFAESIAEVLALQSVWVVRGISLAVLLGLLGINLAGVKWIVRLQLVLLGILAVSTLDFIIGTFSHLDPEHGFVGYSETVLHKNLLPDYTSGETFFTVFGVFFPAATGVMAGFNMSSDLQRPEQNVPVGTLAAVCTSWFLYLVFVFLLGAICTREALHNDFLIAEKVSLVGFLFLLGLYVSSLASCMGGLYGAPRILQCIAQEKVIPALGIFRHGKGANKTPVAAICLTSLMSAAFLFLGQVNTLAPIVTINFMLTYSVIDYSYFCLAMSYDLQVKRARRTPAPDSTLTPAQSQKQQPNKRRPLVATSHPGYGSGCSSVTKPTTSNGTLLEFTRDMDQIFPALPTTGSVEASADGDRGGSVTGPRVRGGRRSKVAAKETLMDSFGLGLDNSSTTTTTTTTTATATSALKDKEQGDTEQQNVLPEHDAAQLPAAHAKCNNEKLSGSGTQTNCSSEEEYGNAGSENKPKLEESEIKPMPNSCHTKLCNHWIALLGALCSIAIMFVIQWVYALLNLLVAVILYLYIGKTSPGLPIGAAAQFSFFRWIRSSVGNLARRGQSPRDQIVVTPSLSTIGMETRQLTEENTDFAFRGRYHQSSFITSPDSIGQSQVR